MGIAPIFHRLDTNSFTASLELIVRTISSDMPCNPRHTLNTELLDYKLIFN